MSNIYLKFYPYLYKVGGKIRICAYFLNEMKHNIVKKRIMKNHMDLILKYKTMSYPPLTPYINSEFPIWIFWWQGYDGMPDVVRFCIESVIRNSSQHKVHLITSKNISDYFPLDQKNSQILNLLNEGVMSYAYFSDILRCYLLYKHGGVWIDATVLLTKGIDDVVENYSFLTSKRERLNNNYYVPQGLWTSFFIYSRKENPLFRFTYEILTAQIIKYHALEDYFMVDYCFMLAYENLSFVKPMIDSIPSFPNRISELIRCLNQPFDRKVYNTLIKDNPFLKLTYKGNWLERTKNGELTYYGFLKQELGS